MIKRILILCLMVALAACASKHKKKIITITSKDGEKCTLIEIDSVVYPQDTRDSMLILYTGGKGYPLDLDSGQIMVDPS